MNDDECANSYEVKRIIDQHTALTQAEALAHREAVRHGMYRRALSGRTLLNQKRFLGYTKGPNGELKIVPEEAEIARKIYELYVRGNGVRKIKRYLEEHGIKTVTGKAQWSTSTIARILSNEKYIGQVVIKKPRALGVLGGSQEKGSVQFSTFIVDNAHEPIIDLKTFEQAQKMKGRMSAQILTV